MSRYELTIRDKDQGSVSSRSDNNIELALLHCLEAHCDCKSREVVQILAGATWWLAQHDDHQFRFPERKLAMAIQAYIDEVYQERWQRDEIAAENVTDLGCDGVKKFVPVEAK